MRCIKVKELLIHYIPVMNRRKMLKSVQENLKNNII